MSRDIEPITGPLPGPLLCASRLCNFGNGNYKLSRQAHFNWLKDTLAVKVGESPNPWIDMFAYASARGSSNGYDNKGLSNKRRDEVKSYIASLVPNVKFVQQEGRGSTLSPRTTTDEGFWQAVEVYAYGGPPPGKRPDHTPAKRRPDLAPIVENPGWFVTGLNLNGASVINGVGVGKYSGKITFWGGGQGATVTRTLNFVGMGLGVGLGVPDIGKVWGKFAEALAHGGSGSLACLPSGSIGMVLPLNGAQKISASELSGHCAVQYLSANVALGGGGTVAIWFGATSSRPDMLFRSARGVAIVATGGIGVSVSLGASLLVAAGTMGA